MAYNIATVLPIVKARLNRLSGDTQLDEYLTLRIQAADEEFGRDGISLLADSMADALLLADMVCWQYQNRDKPGNMPEHLRLRRKERWLHERMMRDDS